MSHLALFYFPTFWHPLSGNGYQLWSGIMGALTIFAGFASALLFAYKHLECHVESPKNCHRLGHPVPGTGHRACHQHHPHAEEKGAITAGDIARHHEESKA